MTRQKNDDPNQLNLLDMLQQEETLISRPKDQPGALNMRAATRQALYESIKESVLDRYEIAAKMSMLLDQEITKAMIDSWTSESKEGHRFPMEYAAAFCMVTGHNKVLEVNCRPVGIFALAGPDAIRSELQRISEQKNEIASQEKELKAMLGLFNKKAKQ